MSTFQITGSLVASFFLLTTSQAFSAETCTFEADPHSLQVQWTAYKTMQKVAVGGSFTEVTLVGDLTGQKSMEALLDQLEAEIDLNSADKIRTGNPARDNTLFQNFFSLFKPKTIKGKLHGTKGDEQSGEIDLILNLNKKTLAVPMKYSRDAKGLLTIKGAIDVNDFGLSDALSKLNKACDALHKGPDGVSKTWPQVEIKLQALIAKKCK